MRVAILAILLSALLVGCHDGDWVFHPIVDYREPSPKVIEVLDVLEAETGQACIDLETADVETLQLIIHIGPYRAGYVADMRSLFTFAGPHDLRIVPGIGERRLAQIVEQNLVCGGD